MPAKVDHAARRRDVAAAVWAVLARGGFAGLTLRAVAAEMGATTGLVTHYFPGRDALVRHALDLLHEHTDASLAHLGEGAVGRAALRTRLIGVLPGSGDDEVLSRIWVSFWGPALADPALREREAARYDRWRATLRPLVQDAIDRGELAPADVSTVIDVLHLLHPWAGGPGARRPRRVSTGAARGGTGPDTQQPVPGADRLTKDKLSAVAFVQVRACYCRSEHAI